MRVCYFGTYDESFPRNRIIIQGLRENGVEVVRCQARLWSGTDDKISGVTEMGHSPFSRTLVSRALGAYYHLWRQHSRTGHYDVMLVGYAGHFDMLMAAALARWRRKPLVFDAFLSLHEAAVVDRRIVAPTSFAARALRAVDRISCSLADAVLMDTQAHIDWYSAEYGLKKARFRRVLMGGEAPGPGYYQPAGRDQTFKVVYFGQFIPLHGVEHIIGAARELQSSADIVFELIGDGQTYGQAQIMAAEAGLKNVTFTKGWLPPDELAALVRSADLCLGIFGAGRKAGLVIPQKVPFALALGKPVLTRDSAAVRELFTPGRDIMVCQPGSARSLAASILELSRNDAMRQTLAREGQRTFGEKFSSVSVGRSMKEILFSVCGAS